MTDILLCSMPFGPILSPSLGLEMLKAGLTQKPYSVKTRYYSLLLAEQVSYRAYQLISNWANLATHQQEIGDWIFSAALFDSSPAKTQEYVEHFLRNPAPALRRFIQPEPEWFVELALAIRKQVGSYLETCLAEIESESPRLVGFSCMMQQKLASLALAKRIKQRWPEIFIVFGGFECDGIHGVELVRQFPFIDAVVSGWGDVVFPEIAARVMAGTPVANLQGVYTQGESLPASDGAGITNALGPADLDILPYPDFTDYFAQIKASGVVFSSSPNIVIETSRGCWWGDRVHCQFCSLNGSRNGYFAKSPQRALAEIEYFADQYPRTTFAMSDLVLCEDYFQNLIPVLAQREKKVDLFYEIRATLSKEQFRQMREAGMTQIQPGIESLSTEVLHLMHKGTTLLSNLQCLKWSQSVGLYVYWNLLYGLPGEAPDAYERMAELVPLISHLPPPYETRLIKIGPSSPLFEQASESGLKIHPSPVYAYIYPFEEAVLKNLATNYIYEYNTPQAVEEYTRNLFEAVKTWIAVHPHSHLTFTDDGERLTLHDQRPVAVAEYHAYTGLQRILYLACDEAQPVSNLQKLATAHTHQKSSVPEIEALLQPMLDRKIMLLEGQRYLSLAIEDTINL
jgi:ribosomal peptide maturation radical SAM protein 1